jgi:hypothetical protein
MLVDVQCVSTMPLLAQSVTPVVVDVAVAVDVVASVAVAVDVVVDAEASVTVADVEAVAVEPVAVVVEAPTVADSATSLARSRLFKCCIPGGMMHTFAAHRLSVHGLRVAAMDGQI